MGKVYFRLLTELVITKRIEPSLWGVTVESKTDDGMYTTFIVSSPRFADTDPMQEVFPEFELRRTRFLPAKLHRWWLADRSTLSSNR